MSVLKKLVEILNNKAKEWDEKNDFRIPKLWDSFGYDGLEKKENSDGTISVNPYKFVARAAEKAVLPYQKEGIDYLQPVSKILSQDRSVSKKTFSNWIEKSSVYGMQIRTFSAWDHDGDKKLELENSFGLKDTGTFIKTIALLPLIKKMGFDAIYTLPITKNSTRYKKGEMGSPYAVKNFFELDPVLYDPMADELSIDEQFKALIEACHILGIRFIIDIIPRTSARDSDFILDHPDWFYWIKIEDLKDYGPPKLTLIKEFTKANEDNIELIYKDPAVQKHIKKFVPSPDRFAPQKWQSIKERCEKDKNLDFFELIEKEIGITTAPAFSDCLNDPQPPWTDVTYLRLYLDHPVQSAKYVEEDQPPYILFDIIRGNIFKGKKPNKDLWEKIANIIVHYQKNFGIDGARIDMGHALPKELEDMIISNARKVDPQFCFIAEELSMDAHKKAKESGYDMIIGDLWAREPRYYQGTLKKVLDILLQLEVPVFAACEIPDSPRAASRLGKREFSRFATALNFFLPNSVPFVTCGQEVYEVQPMNLGLDPQPEGKYMLPKSDPLYGKLAFFDKYALHWTNEGADDMIALIEEVARIRKEYLDFISKENFFKIPHNSKFVLAFGYRLFNEHGKQYLIVVANADILRKRKVSLNLMKAGLFDVGKGRQIDCIYSLKGNKEHMYDFPHITVDMETLDIKILKVK